VGDIEYEQMSHTVDKADAKGGLFQQKKDEEVI